MVVNLNWEGTNMTCETDTDTFLFPVGKQELEREPIYLDRLAGVTIHGIEDTSKVYIKKAFLKNNKK